MESCGIYIPSHERPELARRCLDQTIRIVDGKAPIYLLIDEDQLENYQRKIPEKWDFEYVLVSPIGKRISFAMVTMMEHVKEKGFKYVIRIDDDKLPPENLLHLLEPMKKHDDVGWVGGYFGFYGLLKIQPNTGTYCTFSMGCTINAMDAEKVLEAGSFDADMIVKEDDDMKARLLEKGYYVTICSDVVCQSLGNRGEAGGVSSFEAPDEVALMEHFNESHGGNYSSLRKGKMYVKWAVMAKKGRFPGIDYNRMSMQGGRPLEEEE